MRKQRGLGIVDREIQTPSGLGKKFFAKHGADRRKLDCFGAWPSLRLTSRCTNTNHTYIYLAAAAGALGVRINSSKAAHRTITNAVVGRVEQAIPCH